MVLLLHLLMNIHTSRLTILAGTILFNQKPKCLEWSVRQVISSFDTDDEAGITFIYLHYYDFLESRWYKLKFFENAEVVHDLLKWI